MRVNRWQECGYAAAEGGLSAIETFVRLHFLFFLTNELKIEPAQAGLLVSLGVLWDGLIDPIAGWISDRTRSRLGRRNPYMIAGLVLLPILLCALFAPQLKDFSLSLRILSIGTLYLLLNSAMTLIGVPHAALGGDLSFDEATRNRLFAWRYFFTTVGLLVGIALPGYFLSVYGNNFSAYSQSSIYLAIFVALTTAITVFATLTFDRHTQTHLTNKHSHPLTVLKGLAANKPFLILITAFILATIGQAINSSMALYYYRLHLKLSEADIQKVLVLFTLTIIVSIIGWNVAARKYEKTKLLAFGVGMLGILGGFAYPMFPVGGLEGPLFMAVLGGLLLGSVFLLEVMVSDTVDYGSIKSRSADYGSYFGIWKLGTKVARAIAIGLSGFLLQLIGFSADSPPSQATLESLAWLFGPGVGAFFILGSILILFYPLTSSKVKQMQRIAAKRLKSSVMS